MQHYFGMAIHHNTAAVWNNDQAKAMCNIKKGSCCLMASTRY